MFKTVETNTALPLRSTPAGAAKLCQAIRQVTRAYEIARRKTRSTGAALRARRSFCIPRTPSLAASFPHLAANPVLAEPHCSRLSQTKTGARDWVALRCRSQIGGQTRSQVQELSSSPDTALGKAEESSFRPVPQLASNWLDSSSVGWVGGDSQTPTQLRATSNNALSTCVPMTWTISGCCSSGMKGERTFSQSTQPRSQRSSPRWTLDVESQLNVHGVEGYTKSSTKQLKEVEKLLRAAASPQPQRRPEADPHRASTDPHRLEGAPSEMDPIYAEPLEPIRPLAGYPESRSQEMGLPLVHLLLEECGKGLELATLMGSGK